MPKFMKIAIRYGRTEPSVEKLRYKKLRRFFCNNICTVIAKKRSKPQSIESFSLLEPKDFYYRIIGAP